MIDAIMQLCKFDVATHAHIVVSSYNIWYLNCPFNHSVVNHGSLKGTFCRRSFWSSSFIVFSSSINVYFFIFLKPWFVQCVITLIVSFYNVICCVYIVFHLHAILCCTQIGLYFHNVFIKHVCFNVSPYCLNV